MPRRELEGLLLRMVDFGESDRIVHLLTPESGRLTAMAKGARRSVKRFPGTLDLFNHLRVQLFRSRPGRMEYLQQAKLLSPQLALREKPARFALACFVLELLDRMAPEGGAPADCRKLYDFALEVFRFLEGCEPDARMRTFIEVRAFDALGLRPELRRCVRCGRELEGGAPLGFHVGEGGPVCDRCGRTGEMLLPVHLGTLRALDAVLRLELGQLERLRPGPEALEEAARLVRQFARFHVGIELRSERFLDEMLPLGPPGAA
ncbi:MAG: DNA repair protein RecO [Myxococcota bacterium]